ncbi:unnamed protein product, partial [Staurois parvus]
MTLGTKGLTSGAIKGLTVCCFINCAVCFLPVKYAALHCCAMESNTKQHDTELSPVSVPHRGLVI